MTPARQAVIDAMNELVRQWSVQLEIARPEHREILKMNIKLLVETIKWLESTGGTL